MREIIISNENRFPVGLEGKLNRHRKLAAILHREFKDWILKPDIGIDGLGPTLNDIWAAGKRLIICYGDKHTVNGKKTSLCLISHTIIYTYIYEENSKIF